MGFLNSFLQWRDGWLLIPEPDFIISCLSVMDFLRKQSSQEPLLLFVKGAGEPFLSRRAMRFKRSAEV